MAQESSLLIEICWSELVTSGRLDLTWQQEQQAKVEKRNTALHPS